jgi:osmotically inducible protein OsmC
MAAVRRADVSWDGNLAQGQGVVSASTSGAFTDLPVTWGSRTEESDGRTSPEELVAAAHAACYAMAFSGDLGRNGTPPEHLDVSAAVTFDKLDKWTVTSSAITVRGRVPGIDEDRFREIAEGTRDNCPISRALKGNVELTVEATLES